jgi:hypothetical protein
MPPGNLQVIEKIIRRTWKEAGLKKVTEGVPMTRATVFISYSHQDEAEKNELLDHLRVLQQAGLLEVWSDDQIRGGENWKQKIQEAMAQARVAVLLISAHFLNSDFILNHEVPTLLKRRQEEELKILPVIAKACHWRAIEWLEQINVRPRDGRPIWRDRGQYADEELTRIAEEVEALVREATFQPEEPLSGTDHPAGPNGDASKPKIEFAAAILPPADKRLLFEQILRRMFPDCQRILVKRSMPRAVSAAVGFIW